MFPDCLVGGKHQHQITGIICQQVTRPEPGFPVAWSWEQDFSHRKSSRFALKLMDRSVHRMKSGTHPRTVSCLQKRGKRPTQLSEISEMVQHLWVKRNKRLQSILDTVVNVIICFFYFVYLTQLLWREFSLSQSQTCLCHFPKENIMFMSNIQVSSLLFSFPTFLLLFFPFLSLFFFFLSIDSWFSGFFMLLKYF